MGHAVTHPTQTGMGERRHLLRPGLSLQTYALDVVNHLLAEELSDVVLVGHSFGGLSIAGTADRVPHLIAYLVFLDALLLRPGQTPYGALPSDVVAARRQSCIELDGVRCLPPLPVTAYGIPADHEHAAWVQRQLSPQPESPYESPFLLDHALGNGLPCSYIACTSPRLPSVASTQAWARAQPAWQWHELHTGHDAMITEPELLSQLLVQIGTTGW